MRSEQRVASMQVQKTRESSHRHNVRERERERERQRQIYIYIYIEREREREGGRAQAQSDAKGNVGGTSSTVEQESHEAARPSMHARRKGASVTQGRM
jgi:hypothetical protein